MDFKNKCVFITGISKGIGRATALEFAKCHATILGCARSSEKDIRSLENELEELGVSYRIFKANVSDYASMQKIILECENTFGKIDVLINNAGIIRDASLGKMTEGQWDEVIENNAKSVFVCTKHISQVMKRNGYGKIVNVSSIAASNPNRGQANYAASKGAIEAFTRCIAMELAKYGINVNCVAPGCIDTPMYDNVSKDVINSFKKGIPLGRFGTGKDIANAILFLSSPYAEYITGETIRIDGGFSVSLL